MTRILLTGTQGALGGYIKQYLMQGNVAGEHEIACVSRQDASEAGIHNFRADLLDENAVNRIIKDFRPDKVFLIAWETTHGSYWQDTDNIKWADASIRFAEQAAKKADVFLTFAGTCAEYSWSGEKIVEAVTPEEPHTLYGQQKLRVTRHLLAMRNQGKLDANCCRLFFPYSEFENRNRVTSLVIQAMLENRSIHLRTGDIYRDICHTRHIAAAMCEMNFAYAGGLYNMSMSKPAHLGRFLKRIGKVMGKDHLITWDEWHDDDNDSAEPRYLYGSNEKVVKYLDVADDPTEDIRSFVDASVQRFAG